MDMLLRKAYDMKPQTIERSQHAGNVQTNHHNRNNCYTYSIVQCSNLTTNTLYNVLAILQGIIRYSTQTRPRPLLFSKGSAIAGFELSGEAALAAKLDPILTQNRARLGQLHLDTECESCFVAQISKSWLVVE